MDEDRQNTCYIAIEIVMQVRLCLQLHTGPAIWEPTGGSSIALFALSSPAGSHTVPDTLLAVNVIG